MNDTTYAIEDYKTEIIVEPYLDEKPLRLDKRDKGFTWYRRPVRWYQGKKREVYPESVGSLIRTVCFAKDNACTKPFQIRYGTLASGALSIEHEPEAVKPPEPITTADRIQAQAMKKHLQQATEVDFTFVPPPADDEAYLDLKVWKGFDRGNRNVHFHLREPDAGYKRLYRHLTYVLDLTAYQAAGFRLDGSPSLWYDSRREHECTGRAKEVLDNRKRFEKYRVDPTLAPKSDADDWKWEWKLPGPWKGKDISAGFIDIIWERNLVPPYDVFVSHASENKEEFVDKLVAGLKAEPDPVKTWYDRDRIGLGAELRQSILRGIGFSQYGVFVISKEFFKKSWTKEELEAFLELEEDENLVIPVWYGVKEDTVRKKLPKLSDRLALSAARGDDTQIGNIVREIKSHVRRHARK